MRCSNIGFFLWFKIRHNIIILMINFVGMTNKVISFSFIYDDSDGRISLAWFVGTSSDFIPPTTTSRAPHVHETTGGCRTSKSVLSI